MGLTPRLTSPSSWPTCRTSVGPIFRDEVFKLLDLDFEYDMYHYTTSTSSFKLFSLRYFGVLSHYEESAYIYIHPHDDGRCGALQRLRFRVEGIGDPGTHRFLLFGSTFAQPSSTRPSNPPPIWPSSAPSRTNIAGCIPATPTRTWSRTTTPSFGHPRLCPPTTSRHCIWMVVLRELGAANDYTLFAPLTLRLAKIFRDDSQFVRLSAPADLWWCYPRADGGGGKGTAGSAYTLGRRRKPSGTGACSGSCPFRSSQAAPHVRMASVGSAAQAHALREIELPPQDAAAQPDAAAMGSRFPAMPPPHHGVEHPRGDWSLAGENNRGQQPASLTIVEHEDLDFVDWPSFRDLPVWIPSPTADSSN
ncbi:hypothetical protein CYMTET_31737 [Cymbomonas tetramitiformis]|uniref:Uncharacterized protein n=1 Tax=Cymbomonas tetramitiformis TaxID=36881 RepID=A0AAE0FGJ6_9CHLO|nr:hypothetical protein CYMTET_31737 [Cymbomonas tetramitiformis]